MTKAKQNDYELGVEDGFNLGKKQGEKDAILDMRGKSYYNLGKIDGKANKEIKIIKSRQLGYDEGKANKEAYAKQKVEEALKKAKTDYIGAFNLGCKAGEKRINKQKQIEVLERVQDCFNEIVNFEDSDAIVGVFNKQLKQELKKLKEANE